MTQINKKTQNIIIYLLFAIFFFTGFFTFKDYGISIDEDYGRRAGFYWLDYVLSFTSFEEIKNSVSLRLDQIHGFTILSPEDYPWYGVPFDLPVAFLETIFEINDPKEYFYFKHFLNFFLFFISSIFFYRLLLNRFSNYYISLIGTLFFVLSPRIYGSSFFNNKDVVFLSFVTIALFYCFKLIDKQNYKNILMFSLFAALSTSQRIIGIFLPILFIVFYLLSVLSKNENIKKWPDIVLLFIFYCLFLIIFWPYLWNNPVDNFIGTFKFFSDHPYTFKMLFDGNYIDIEFVPYNYIFIWVLISTPILYSILFVAGYIKIFKRFFLKFINVSDNKHFYDLWRGVDEKKDLFVLFSITSIICYLISFDVILYTGWRQLYFINAFLIYIAAYSIHIINLNLKSKLKKKIGLAGLVLYVTFVIFKMIVYHPYQNVYFNNFFNKSAHERFEVDYWGLSGKKSLEDILLMEKDKSLIKVGVASYLPLERSIKLLDKKDRKRIKVIGQEFQSADYLYTNFISEVDKNLNDKYKVPSNFTSVSKFSLDNILVYEIFKKNN